MKTKGIYLCDGCIDIFNDQDMRFKPLIYYNQAKKTILERAEVLNILSHPPQDDFVMTLPYSFKKHHWLYAGLSNNKIAYIGIDERTIIIDYTNDIKPKEAIQSVLNLLKIGVPRNSVKTGKYPLYVYSNFFNDIEESEEILKDYRPTGAVELFATYAPANGPKARKTKREVDYGMITSSEQNAIEILKTIANSSEMRRTDGMSFWGSMFLRRVNRHKHLELHKFISEVASSVASRVTGLDLGSKLKNLKKEEEVEIMKEINEKPKLLVSMAYSQLKESK